MTYAGIVFGVVTFLVGVFGPLPEFWKTICLVGSALYLVATWFAIYRPAVFTGLQSSALRVATGLVPGIDPFMPFTEACRDLYQANVDTWLGQAARLDPGGGANPVRWCAYWIASRFSEIYGRRLPSTEMELVPKHLFTYAHFSDDATRLIGGDRGDYSDLAVKRRAFRAVLPTLGDQGI